MAHAYAFYFTRNPHREPRDLLLCAISRTTDLLLASFAGRTKGSRV